MPVSLSFESERETGKRDELADTPARRSEAQKVIGIFDTTNGRADGDGHGLLADPIVAEEETDLTEDVIVQIQQLLACHVGESLIQMDVTIQ